MKALVLSGGGIKGAWQAGAIRALIEQEHYKPDIITGISVGSINGLFLKCKYEEEKDWNSVVKKLTKIWESIEEPSQLFKKYSIAKIIWDILRKKFNGLAKPEGIYNIIKSNITIPDTNTVEYFYGYTDLNTGKIRYSSDLSNLDMVFASASIPILFPRVRDRFVDGGLIDIAPLKKAIQEGADEIVCIITSPRENNITDINYGNILLYIERVFDIMISNTLYNDLDVCEKKNKIEGYKKIKLTIIYPKNKLNYSIYNFNKEDISAMITAGYWDAVSILKNENL